MARFGKLPVSCPSGVKVSIDQGFVVVEGPKATLRRQIPSGVEVDSTDTGIVVSIKSDTKVARSNQGTLRSHIVNMIKGVSEGWSKVLELVGAGFRAEVKEGTLTLFVGFSHPVVFNAGKTSSFKIDKSFITIEGPDKEEVGQLAASIRAVRPPDPYRGKGIKFRGEVLRKKAGKAAAKGATA